MVLPATLYQQQELQPGYLPGQNVYQQHGYQTGGYPQGQTVYYQTYPPGYQSPNYEQQRSPVSYRASAPPQDPQMGQGGYYQNYPPGPGPMYYPPPPPPLGTYPQQQPQVVYVTQDPGQGRRNMYQGNRSDDTMKNVGIGALLMALCCCCCGGAPDADCCD